jgi:hypothetical protein
MLQTLLTQQWDEHFPDSIQKQAVNNLEIGNILYFPSLTFSLLESEKVFLSPDYADPKTKNISYDFAHNKLWGVHRLNDEQRFHLSNMMNRFARQSLQLIQFLLPRYTSQLCIGRTSYRPVEINSRKTSLLKDDKRLHVDAFPSAPNQGKRILRVFSNINPEGKDRVWRVGEPFEKVAMQFLPHMTPPLPMLAHILRLLKITKSYRTLYDHYMLQLHNKMKTDEHYQREAIHQTIHFKPGSSWIVLTDHVSHAALEGQYVLEQTFYLPVKAMKHEAYSPLRILERLFGKELI